jgi:putative peptidoglycan lipid II flippase
MNVARQISLPIPSFTRGLSVNSVILRAALSVGVAGLIVKAAATCKEIAVAGVYGRGDAMDAFLAAALIPSLLVNLIAESMNQVLVPTLIGVREREGREAAQRLLSSAMLWLGVLLVAASGAMALAAHAFFPLIASHFPPGKLALSIRRFALRSSIRSAASQFRRLPPSSYRSRLLPARSPWANASASGRWWLELLPER